MKECLHIYKTKQEEKVKYYMKKLETKKVRDENVASWLVE
jgi:hypothetical protein